MIQPFIQISPGHLTFRGLQARGEQCWWKMTMVILSISKTQHYIVTMLYIYTYYYISYIYIYNITYHIYNITYHIYIILHIIYIYHIYISYIYAHPIITGTAAPRSNRLRFENWKMDEAIGPSEISWWRTSNGHRFSGDIYPLVNVYITMESSTIFNGKIHYFYGHFQ